MSKKLIFVWLLFFLTQIVCHVFTELFRVSFQRVYFQKGCTHSFYFKIIGIESFVSCLKSAKLALRGYTTFADNRASPYSVPDQKFNKGDPMQQQQEDEEFDVKRNLIVNYLPQTFTQDEVSQMFSRIGPVSNCKLIRNYSTGQSLGYAFIEYPTAQLAEDAINQLDGMNLQDKKLKVSYARPSSTEIKNSNVYVAGLPSWVDEDRLLTLFSPFGSIITHKILTDAASKSRGVGFVRYSLKSDAEKAIESMAGKVLPDSTSALIVKLAIPPASKQLTAVSAQQPLNSMPGVAKQVVQYNPMAVSNPVYVYGLQPHHSELTLYELFAPFGGILNVKLIRDNAKPEKPCKGYGFVNFRKQEEALAAIGTMHNHAFDGKTLQVSFKQNKQLGTQAAAMNLLVHQGIATSPIAQNNLSVGLNYGYGAVGQGVYR